MVKARTGGLEGPPVAVQIRGVPLGYQRPPVLQPPLAAVVHERQLAPESVLVRRSTLEDVFLRLTGRTLID